MWQQHQQVQQMQQRPNTHIEGILAEQQLDLWNKEVPETGQDLSQITEIIMRGKAWSNVQMLLPLLAQLSHDQRWLAWVAPPQLLPKAQLQAAGFDLNKIILLKPDAQCKRSGTSHSSTSHTIVVSVYFGSSSIEMHSQSGNSANASVQLKLPEKDRVRSSFVLVTKKDGRK